MNTYPVWVLMCPAIDTVVTDVQAAFREPNDIAVLESAASNGLEVAMPVHELSSGLEE